MVVIGIIDAVVVEFSVCVITRVVDDVVAFGASVADTGGSYWKKRGFLLPLSG